MAWQGNVGLEYKFVYKIQFGNKPILFLVISWCVRVCSTDPNIFIRTPWEICHNYVIWMQYILCKMYEPKVMWTNTGSHEHREKENQANQATTIYINF